MRVELRGNRDENLSQLTNSVLTTDQIAFRLKGAFKSRDMLKILECRQELERRIEPTTDKSEKAYVQRLLKIASGAWEKHKALQLIQSSSSLDEQTKGLYPDDSPEKFKARAEYRKAAVAIIGSLPLDKCAEGAVLETAWHKLGGSTILRDWETELEKRCLYAVGKAGWLSIDQTRVSGSMLSIVPHRRLNGESSTGADTLELTKDGDRLKSPRALLDRLKEATELLPGVYLRHLAFTKQPELRMQAALTLQSLILNDEWKAVSGDVRERFETMRKTSMEELQKKLVAIVPQLGTPEEERKKSPPVKPTEEQQMAAIAVQIQWSRDFASKSYEFVATERAAGRLALSVTGERAFKELEGMYGGGDEKTQKINH